MQPPGDRKLHSVHNAQSMVCCCCYYRDRRNVRIGTIVRGIQHIIIKITTAARGTAHSVHCARIQPQTQILYPTRTRKNRTAVRDTASRQRKMH